MNEAGDQPNEDPLDAGERELAEAVARVKAEGRRRSEHQAAMRRDIQASTREVREATERFKRVTEEMRRAGR